MSDQDRRLYTVAAFITGVLFTIGVDRICWYWRWQHHRQAAEDADGSTTPQRRVGPPRRTGTVLGKAQEENELEEQIAQGIEGCIGNTPLIRIKSLSDATNCDILCKAEVASFHYHLSSREPALTESSVSQRCWRQPQGSRGSQHREEGPISWLHPCVRH